jgi:hypothetical protein
LLVFPPPSRSILLIIIALHTNVLGDTWLLLSCFQSHDRENNKTTSRFPWLHLPTKANSVASYLNICTYVGALLKLLDPSLIISLTHTLPLSQTLSNFTAAHVVLTQQVTPSMDILIALKVRVWCLFVDLNVLLLSNITP